MWQFYWCLHCAMISCILSLKLGTVGDNPSAPWPTALPALQPGGRSAIVTSSDEQPRTVLIVDDNTQLLVMVSAALRHLGHFRVVVADNGVDGLERYYDSQPDCMVIDVRMPGLDGYQLVRALRGDPDSATTPLIILTAMAQDRDRFAGLAAGVDQYLLKPVKPQKLVAAIQQAITISDAERAERLRALAEAPPDDAAEGGVA
jgi:CheY-like chemotaxis protein